MKKLILTILTLLLIGYGFCYIDKNGTDDLPTTEEYTQYLAEKKDEAMEVIETAKEWLIETDAWKTFNPENNQPVQ